MASPAVPESGAAAAGTSPAYGEGVAPARAPATPPMTLEKTPAPGQAAAQGDPLRVAADAPVRPRRTWDVALTFGFLAVAVVFITTSIPGFSDFAATMNSVGSLLGSGDYSDPGLASGIGIALNVTQIVLFLATVLVSSRLLRRNRLSFYVPLIGGAIFFLIFLVLIIVAMMADPALVDALSKRS